MVDHNKTAYVPNGGKYEHPIERKVDIVSSSSAGSFVEKIHSCEDAILLIKLNESEIMLFDILKETAKAWEEGTVKATTNISLTPKKKIQIRIAGGWVRDKILGLSTHDVDVALDTCTGVDFANILTNYYKSVNNNSNNKNNNNTIGKIGVILANPSQSKHLETATMKIFGNDVDFCNLRHETYAEDSRIPDTVFGTPLEDSFRRDCTMNALYYNLNTERIEDWTHVGLEDLLHTKVVDTPLIAYQTFHDDPLRVLRVIRFAVRYNMTLSEDIIMACKHPKIHDELRRKVSRERVGKELEGMLSGKHANPIKAMDLICAMNLGDSVFYLPSNTDLIGTVGQQGLKPVIYTLQQETSSRIRDCAWDETRRCLKVLSFLLDELNIQRSNVGSLTIPMINDKDASGTTTSATAPSVAIITPVDSRLVYLAVFLLPYSKLLYIDKKQRTKNVVEYMIQEGIKFKNKDVQCLSLVIGTLDDMTQLLQQTANITRLQIGLLLRAARGMWTTVLIVATVSLLRSERDRLWCARAKEVYETIVVKMNLDECWKTKPLMNGKSLIQALDLDRGPQVGVYMEEQVKWILINPTGTIEELQRFLKAFKYTRESKDVSIEPVSKKAHH